MSATLFDTAERVHVTHVTHTADPACHVCDGTGYDGSFQSPCTECYRGAPIRARFGDEPHAPSLPTSSTSTGRSSSTSTGPAPAADASSTAEADLADWLREQTWSDFAQSLARDYMRRGYFTPKQYESAARMRTKCDARNAERIEATPSPSTPAPEVVEGWYALPQTEGAPVAFYRVDTPSDGRWAGRVFLTRITGAQTYPVRGPEARTVLAAIAADVDAGPRYGREIGSCCRCNRVLTDAASRAAGIGPYCATKGA